MRVLITGGRGQLATDLIPALAGFEVMAPGREELDVSDVAALEAVFATFEPEVVINTAAYHNVDRCESEPEQSFLINAAVPQRLAAACRQTDALFVHLSTDYVFNGRQRRPYTERDAIDPVSVYGASKAAGELAVRGTTDKHLIVRTTGLYGHAGVARPRGNFVETMLRLASRGEPITVVGDQILTPSFTRHVAKSIVALIERGATGTVHVTNTGECSWHEFTAEIFRLSGHQVDLKSTTQAEWHAPARRPEYSVLAHDGLLEAGVSELPHWQDALAEYLAGRETAREAGTAVISRQDGPTPGDPLDLRT